MVKDDVSKAKIVNVSSGIEGSGIYSCTAPSHPEPFSTSDKEEWAKHLREYKHYSQGQDLCAICGQSVNMNVIPTRAGNKPIHPECIPDKEEL